MTWQGILGGIIGLVLGWLIAEGLRYLAGLLRSEHEMIHAEEPPATDDELRVFRHDHDHDHCIAFDPESRAAQQEAHHVRDHDRRRSVHPGA